MKAAPAAVFGVLEGADLIDLGHVTEPRAAVFAMRVFEENELVATVAVKGLHRVVGGSVIARCAVRAVGGVDAIIMPRKGRFSMTSRKSVAARVACTASIEKRSPACPFVSH
jgi:high-affinity K+ transport system ATPase subunit B